MDKDEFKQQYIDAVTRHSRSMVEGYPHQTNKLARTMAALTDKIKKSEIDKTVLVDLLDHESIAVKANVAAEMLRQGYEVHKAERVLDQISRLTGKDSIERSEISSVKLALWLRRENQLKKGYQTSSEAQEQRIEQQKDSHSPKPSLSDDRIERLYNYFDDTMNGGHLQYFTNSFGVDYAAVIGDLRLIGAEKYADILSEAVDLKTKCSGLDQCRAQLSDIDTKFDSVKPDLSDILEQYEASEST